jgi:hypothetical protein
MQDFYPDALQAELPCATLKEKLKAGTLTAIDGTPIKTQLALARMTDISQADLCKAINNSGLMFRHVQQRGGKPRWKLICDAVGLPPSVLFPELPFEQAGKQYGTFVNPGGTCELLPAAGATKIEIQATGNPAWVRLDGSPPRPPTLGFWLAAGAIQSFILSGLPVHVAASSEPPGSQTYVTYRWLR